MRRICTTALLLGALSAPAFAQSAIYPYGGQPGYAAQQPPPQQYYYAQQPRDVNASANYQQGYANAAPQGYPAPPPQTYAAAARARLRGRACANARTVRPRRRRIPRSDFRWTDHQRAGVAHVSRLSGATA